MNNCKLSIKTISKLMTLSLLFILVIFPIHDEMDKYSLEKDIVIHSDVLEHKIKKSNLDAGTFLISFLQVSYQEPDSSKTLTIFSSFTLINSFSTTILRL
jgi:hypothetical protein